ncbi:head-tail joining protein [Desulfoluna spongiiphila]|uniref:head-tail joining protein n=1 Tax=Desulfoluna spongiiphila TaxID=419481 RepID=UPI00125678BE|nr:hypothetical protein [Desulfoluna spongiiphila]VVS95351.1 hypothetical protein DBB_49280 [Desulfoluna spongiiphila]
MALDDVFDQAAADMWAIVGSEAMFRPVGVTPVPCLIEVERDVELQPDSYEATVIERGITVEAMVAEVGEPKRGDVFEAGGVSYTVRKIVENDGQFVKVVVNENHY